ATHSKVCALDLRGQGPREGRAVGQPGQLDLDLLEALGHLEDRAGSGLLRPHDGPRDNTGTRPGGTGAGLRRAGRNPQYADRNEHGKPRAPALDSTQHENLLIGLRRSAFGPQPSANRPESLVLEQRSAGRQPRADRRGPNSLSAQVACDLLQHLGRPARFEVEVVLVDVDDLDARLDDLVGAWVVGLDGFGVIDGTLVMAMVRPSPTDQ